ncbi:hypothetical protein LJK88_04475 [Paenibacillus sp. P26]|nr:hypothetical protein LJK88_04475 [Paenibacillus sp. P26]UUZ90671.1 hypothetical protein LJK87_33035 [Paenibacillus sp. P25]
MPTAVFADTPANAVIVSTQSLSAYSKSILANLQLQKTTFSVPFYGSDINNVKKFMNEAMKADDYIGYIISGYTIKVSTGSKNTFTATFNVTYRETKDQTAYVKSKSKEILASILKDGMTDFEKERTIHDWIVKNVAYDKSKAIPESSYTAYGALKSGKAVCQGYTLLTYRLLSDAGITNRIVRGTVRDEGHSWNLVKLDGLWYHLDTTWDDPTPDRKDMVSYRYYNVTDTQLSRDHAWTESDYPTATTDFRNLLNDMITSDSAKADAYKTLLFDLGGVVTNDTEALKAKIQEAIAAKKREFVFTHDFGNQDMDKVIDSIIFGLDMSNMSIGYSVDYNSNGVATLIFNASYW